MARGNTELCMTPSPGEAVDVTLLLKRQRSSSSNASDSGFEGVLSPLEEEPMSVGSPLIGSPLGMYMPRQRVRYVSESESSVTSQQVRKISVH